VKAIVRLGITFFHHPQIPATHFSAKRSFYIPPPNLNNITSINRFTPPMMADPIPSTPVHPFYPIEAEVVGYLANKWSVPTLLALFFGGFAVILGTTLPIVNLMNPRLPKWDKAIVLWFVLCKCDG
jgi:hypothetical protein